METPGESPGAGRSSASALSPWPSSSPSSFSSSSDSSSSCGVTVVPVSCSTNEAGLKVGETCPVREFLLDGGSGSFIIEKLRFLDSSCGREWKQVEDRFDRIILNRNRGEPAVKWSEFSYCVGMQKSPEFAKELLRALRGRSELKSDITKTELHDFWCRMTDSCYYSRIQIFFDMCDRDMDGSIDELDIKQMILLSASTNKLSLTHEEVEEYAALIMDVLDTDELGYIDLPQVETLLKIGLSKDQSLATAPHSMTSHRHDRLGFGPSGPNRNPMLRGEALLRANWRRVWFVLLWLIVCLVLFTWKFIQYRQRAAFEVMGYCVCTAKGAAETLKFNMAVILLPVCRNTVTWLRTSHPINSVIPFNDNINFHKLVASGIVIGVILHGGIHLVCDFPRISGSDWSIFRQTIGARFQYHQPSYIDILATIEVASGITMVILMAVAFSLATKWPRRQSSPLPRSVRRVTGYNTFWYSHHLFVFVYALLIVHSMFLFLTNNVYEKTTWMYIAFPVLLYTGERIFRAVRSGFYNVKILRASTYPGKVLFLSFSKPDGFVYRSGMSIYVQCPQISPFEWHPFSLTSGPNEDHLSVHIRSLGDWSYDLYSIFQEDYVKYDIVVLIGLGIGATPFLSILKDVMHKMDSEIDTGEYRHTKGPSKAYLFWVTREHSSFAWFQDFIRDVSKKTSQNQWAVEMHNFLTCMYKEDDARAALLSAIQVLYHAKRGTDIISKTPVRTHFARPNWFRIFLKLSRRHRGARIGVFYCGASGLARELESLCTKFSTKTATRFVFHKEHY
ncbi:respiratory burst oxidase homolog protein A-like isoform X2 [Punica granatum]|uniref:Respiratory burst oxidase homolog protein A-like isoform X2 n=1 Tax=Punica granatum TaxID=22663 RepID=A0A6P8EDM3_PUNGR|nr:respiratory burst oxidase homolog protein A-like isoform X2 [Punica granatum]